MTPIVGRDQGFELRQTGASALGAMQILLHRVTSDISDAQPYLNRGSSGINIDVNDMTSLIRKNGHSTGYNFL
ncbi:hypothetical protein CTI10_008885 [Delftia acidovorans]|nr:hypothetical protein CTI10_008885 [Delftia acidovorans]